MLPPNTRAPEFTLPDSNGSPVSLSDFLGSPVVLVFYPKDHSAVCTKQLNDYAAHVAEFESAGAKILAVSTDDVRSHDRFQVRCAFPFPLLADADREVCRSYDVLNLLGMAQRAVYILDAEGMIRFAYKTFPAWYIKPERLLQELNT